MKARTREEDIGTMDILGGHEVLVGTYEEYVLGYAPKEDKSGMSFSFGFCLYLEVTKTNYFLFPFASVVKLF